MSCNVQKTKCMVSNPKSRARLVRDVFLPFKVGSCDIQFVSDFKYLGHMINNRIW